MYVASLSKARPSPRTTKPRKRLNESPSKRRSTLEPTLPLNQQSVTYMNDSALARLLEAGILQPWGRVEYVEDEPHKVERWTGAWYTVSTQPSKAAGRGPTGSVQADGTRHPGKD